VLVRAQLDQRRPDFRIDLGNVIPGHRAAMNPESRGWLARVLFPHLQISGSRFARHEMTRWA
jgi:hypothetical protein